jgi:hypothetical protein
LLKKKKQKMLILCHLNNWERSVWRSTWMAGKWNFASVITRNHANVLLRLSSNGIQPFVLRGLDAIVMKIRTFLLLRKKSLKKKKLKKMKKVSRGGGGLALQTSLRALYSHLLETQHLPLLCKGENKVRKLSGEWNMSDPNRPNSGQGPAPRPPAFSNLPPQRGQIKGKIFAGILKSPSSASSSS